ncbi:hypothetical protein ACTXT7_013392 [Hymenolepis weldensis]
MAEILQDASMPNKVLKNASKTIAYPKPARTALVPWTLKKIVFQEEIVRMEEQDRE